MTLRSSGRLGWPVVLLLALAVCVDDPVTPSMNNLVDDVGNNPSNNPSNNPGDPCAETLCPPRASTCDGQVLVSDGGPGVAGGDACDCDYGDVESRTDCAALARLCNQAGGTAQCLAECASECPQIGARRCSGNTVEVCVVGAHSCTIWRRETVCDDTETCGESDSGAGCSVGCGVGCPLGASQCGGPVVQTCVERSGDGCLVWENTEQCSEEGSCVSVGQQAQCVEGCTDQCDADGQTRCLGTVVQQCTRPPMMSGCLDWRDGLDCADSGAECRDSEGVATCRVPVPEPGPGDVVVTEIMSNPVGSDSHREWFEIANTTAHALDLGALVFSEAGGSAFELPGGTTLAEGGYFVLGSDADMSVNGGANVDFEYGTFNLNNDRDTIRIVRGGVEIDSLSYDESAGWPNPNGASVAISGDLDLAAVDRSDPSNWCLATAPYGDGGLGSPGVANASCGDVCASDCTAAGDQACRDNHVWTCVDVAGCLTQRDDLDCGAATCQAASGAATCVAGGPRAAGVGDLVITELMPNPAGVTDALGEWFEITNATGEDLSLAGVGFAPVGGSPSAMLPSGTVLAAHAAFVVAKNSDGALNGGLSADAEYSSLQLSNTSADTLSILASSGEEIDRVEYDPDLDWSVPTGASMQLDGALELATVDNNLASHWCAGSGPYGTAGDLGSPGLANLSCN